MVKEMKKHYRIKFEPMGIQAEVEADISIAEAAESMNVPIRADCGGEGLCGKCRIIAEPLESLSSPTEPELDILSPEEIRASYRLGCQARVRGDLTVTVPEQMADSREARGKTGLRGKYPVAPMVERIVLGKGKQPEPRHGVLMDLATWTAERASKAAGHDVYMEDLGALRQLSHPAASDGEVTLVNHKKKGVTAVLPGNRPKSLGLAVDMGTTTLAAYLCDLQTGEILTSAASVNPQRRYGEDVISRIAMADKREDGLDKLNRLIVDGINYLLKRCVEQAGASPEDVDEVTLAGNTTMERILIGFHPHGLGVSPYLPVLSSPRDLRAEEVGLGLNPGTNVFLFPVISGFVGGDTIGAIIADAPFLRKEIGLIVDIGTNGELVLGNRDGLWATSCATGPALEGAQISCGMRAVSGAIHQVEVDPSTGDPLWSVLGDGDDIRPLGICGSGLIDAIAVMRKIGVLLENGRLKEGMPGVINDEKGIGREYVLVPAEKSGTGKNISILLKDVRQFQLAKSALYVGIELLMKHSGVTGVARTVLTGAFGTKFNWRHAVDIGMLPREAVGGKVLSLDNLAGVGAIMALLNKKQRDEAARLASTTKFIELAMDPEFNTRFPEATVFPPLDDNESIPASG
ncbi:MAG: ferredoxin [Deltaproteobacteria bacterium]|nr:MAG: ferredoxin [Deltaproteobacteria bacterium]